MAEKLTIAWHPAFCSAAEFDLRDDRQNLSFDPEHNLSREPLRMDLLIIKKKKEETSSNDIARLFRMHNVVEYKSPDDGLTIDDFYKTLAYACLYKGTAHTVNEIPSDEITISIFREAYPRELMKMLHDEGTEIENAAPGIYVMKNQKPFPTQIVVTKELDPRKHAGLRILSRNASEEDINTFFEQASQESSQGENLNIKAILTVSYAANMQTYDNMKRRNPVMNEALKLFMKDEIEEERNDAAMEKAKEMAINLSKEGMNVDFIAKVTHEAKDTIQKWLSVQLV